MSLTRFLCTSLCPPHPSFCSIHAHSDEPINDIVMQSEIALLACPLLPLADYKEIEDRPGVYFFAAPKPYMVGFDTPGPPEPCYLGVSRAGVRRRVAIQVKKIKEARRIRLEDVFFRFAYLHESVALAVENSLISHYKPVMPWNGSGFGNNDSFQAIPQWNADYDRPARRYVPREFREMVKSDYITRDG